MVKKKVKTKKEIKSNYIKKDYRPMTYDNPDLEYSYDASGRLQYIDMTLAKKLYRKTLSYDGSGRVNKNARFIEKGKTGS